MKIKIKNFQVTVLPMVTRTGLQRIELSYNSSAAAHLRLQVFEGNGGVIGGMAADVPVAIDGGKKKTVLMLPEPEKSFPAMWKIIGRDGEEIAAAKAFWEKPRELTLYVMVSSHTDIGLHNSPYIQRERSEAFLDMAKKLCEKTDSRTEEDRYRYTMEGTWFFGNYEMDRGKEATEELVRDYIKTGKIGLCSGVAGNHTQVYGLEEMCRSTYERKHLREDWGMDCRTLSMIDNNGMSMAMIQPYADAGYENIIFAPNQWNPIEPSVWNMDKLKCEYGGYRFNPNAGGGGSRIDVGYDSSLPMVFYWEDNNKNRLLVWASTQYNHGGASFGLFPRKAFDRDTLSLMEAYMARQLPDFEKKYPYDIWLFACYWDDQEPDLELTNSIQAWNAKWKWPRIRTLGNPDLPFQLLKEKYGRQIPVLKGDITGGWYQHPVSAPDLLAQKFEADRLLAEAEKWSTVAGLLNEAYEYPAQDLKRAWKALLYNDEHSYGTSGYQGRRVYETWMQHRDWIEKALGTAKRECGKALQAIAENIAAEEEKVVVFNAASGKRTERISLKEEGKYCIAEVPEFGYLTLKKKDFLPCPVKREVVQEPPVIENRYYRIAFSGNGSLQSVYDKELRRELLDPDNSYHGNEAVYTKDNHKSFSVPEKAVFEVITEAGKITVNARTQHKESGAEILQSVSLAEHEKRIDIDNRLNHVRDMINSDRYARYLYYAFPFLVKNSRRFCHLNGTVAEYAKDVTGHGTDVYMAANEWCCAQNKDYGVALFLLDSQLMEFDHIHPDKTDFGNTGDGSQIFCYVANDWLQMHAAGGSHLHFRFRYAITSYAGDYRQAGIPQMAERYATPVQTVTIPLRTVTVPAQTVTVPVQTVTIPTQTGMLPEKSCSFLQIHSSGNPQSRKKVPGTECANTAEDTGNTKYTEYAGYAQRLICLKRADDGQGIIARLYGSPEKAEFCLYGKPGITAERVQTDETSEDRKLNNGIKFRNGVKSQNIEALCFTTYRIGKEEIRLKEREPQEQKPEEPVYTGLITEPRAACGEKSGQLYLLWGKCMEKDLSHYRLYRSEVADFTPDDTTFAAEVLPGKYRVECYEDTGLKEHTWYYYRVCAVSHSGQTGRMSEVFSAVTRECLEDSAENVYGAFDR